MLKPMATRRVYFGFDYEDVSDFRANVVRNHNFTAGIEKTYIDASIWEEAKKKSPAAIKALIDAEIENTSVTAILIGSGTFQRRWVRYEIFKSIYRSNKVIGVHINSIKDKYGQTKALGPNPLEYLALKYSQDGTSVTPIEYDGTGWVSSPDMPAYTLGTVQVHNANQSLPLTRFTSVYDWVAGDGFNNFGTWIA